MNTDSFNRQFWLRVMRPLRNRIQIQCPTLKSFTVCFQTSVSICVHLRFRSTPVLGSSAADRNRTRTASCRSSISAGEPSLIGLVIASNFCSRILHPFYGLTFTRPDPQNAHRKHFPLVPKRPRNTRRLIRRLFEFDCSEIRFPAAWLLPSSRGTIAF